MDPVQVQWSEEGEAAMASSSAEMMAERSLKNSARSAGVVESMQSLSEKKEGKIARSTDRLPAGE